MFDGLWLTSVCRTLLLWVDSLTGDFLLFGLGFMSLCGCVKCLSVGFRVGWVGFGW